METLTINATQEQIDAAMARFDLEVNEVNGITNLYEGESWKGNWKTDKEVLIDEINRRIEAINDKKADADHERAKLEAALEGATEAVAFDSLGNPALVVKTNVRSGGTIAYAAQTTNGGTPVNTVNLKVSRAKKYLAKANELGYAAPKLDNRGDLYYS